VILKRVRMSPAEILAVKTAGTFDAGVVDTATCELEVGGQMIATGRVLKRRGRSYLKITRVSLGSVGSEEEGDE